MADVVKQKSIDSTISTLDSIDASINKPTQVDAALKKETVIEAKTKDYVSGLYGERGNDGFSPIITFEEIENGHRMIVTDSIGTKYIDLFNGRDGIDGKDGNNGIDGIDGRNGNNGIDGIDGRNGIDGVDGQNGKDGVDGINGENGKDGRDGVDGQDGERGEDGQPGRDGIDGKSAYDVAVDNGFSGTQAEWLESLKNIQFDTTIAYIEHNLDDYIHVNTYLYQYGAGVGGAGEGPCGGTSLTSVLNTIELPDKNNVIVNSLNFGEIEEVNQLDDHQYCVVYANSIQNVLIHLNENTIVDNSASKIRQLEQMLLQVQKALVEKI